MICKASHSSLCEGCNDYVHPLKVDTLLHRSPAINAAGLEEAIDVLVYWWKCPRRCELGVSPDSLFQAEAGAWTPASLVCPALISKMLLMTYLWSQPQRDYWSERQIIGCICTELQGREMRSSLSAWGSEPSLTFLMPRRSPGSKIRGP